jgi:hypothetical protein
MTPALTRAALVALAFFAPVWAQDGFDEEAVALTYHKVSGEPLDVDRAAEQTDAVMRASAFDRPDAIKAQATRLRDRMAAASAATEFVLPVNTVITQFDHDLGEFSIQLFTPGHYVELEAFRQSYRLVFANADRARRMPMPKEEARSFDGRLNSMGRGVTAEARFRVVGKGDPSGAVADGNVIRGELVAVRVLDRNGNLLFTPDLNVASPGERNAGAFDAAKADVAGLRVGVKASDLEATLKRLYGKASRGGVNSNSYAKFAGTVSMNPSGCFSVRGRRGNPVPGTVCISAQYDSGEVVRAIRIERYFPWFDSDVLRKTLLQKYGPVSGVRGGLLGWGPEVEGVGRALTAHYSEDIDFMDEALNRRAPNVKVALQLVDAVWVSANRR